MLAAFPPNLHPSIVHFSRFHRREKGAKVESGKSKLRCVALSWDKLSAQLKDLDAEPSLNNLSTLKMEPRMLASYALLRIRMVLSSYPKYSLNSPGLESLIFCHCAHLHYKVREATDGTSCMLMSGEWRR